MAILYLDPVGGNDANDGLSFANRVKTITSGITAARTAPGDIIRIIASPDPVNAGTATWTDNSGTITWGAQKNLVIDNCETNYTASANVTCALSTTRRKQGSNGLSITPATAFTTGKLCHFTLPATLDLSAYEQVSLWFRYGSLTTAGQLELKLCSDTTGDTAVNTLALPAGVNGQWRAVVLNNAAALGASIASIALYATADPGTTAMYMDNIVACKAAGTSDCVTHEHVIGKNTGGEPDWYSILSIADSSVDIGGAYDTELGGSLAPQPYRGTTETVATYTLLGMPGWTTAQYTVQESGSDGSLITYSGGWNRTDMSTQTGVTYLQGSHYLQYGFTTATRTYIKTEKIGGLNYTGAIGTCSTGASLNHSFEQAVGCGFGEFYSASAIDRFARIKFDSMQGITTNNGFQMVQAGTARREIRGRRIHGSLGDYAMSVYEGTRYVIDKIDNNQGWGVRLQNLTLTESATLIGTLFQNNTVGDFGQDIEGSLIADGCTFTPPSIASGYTGSIKSTRHGGSATDHRIITRHWTLASATDQRHTASDFSWKINPTNTGGCTSDLPAQFPLARVAVNASALVTVKCWVRRDNAGLNVGMRVLNNALPGIGDADVDVMMTAAIDTWEEITLTFTPTVAGVIDIYGIAWGGTTYSGWFDDMTITQA